MSLLVGAKVLNVTVPFIFKYAIDGINEAATVNGEALMGMATVPQALGTAAFSLLIGCKSEPFLFYSKNVILLML